MNDFTSDSSRQQEINEEIFDTIDISSGKNETMSQSQSDINSTDNDGEASQTNESTDCAEAEAQPEAQETECSSQQISELSAKMDALTELFKAKIETDEYKNHLFDEMHRKLAKYQDDALKAVIEPFISELIILLENVRQYERFTPEEATPENYAKLRKRLADVRGDIEDILEEMDVSKYETDDQVPDTKRQKIIKTVRTEDASKNNTIESKLSDGYIYGNKIIKYEKVAVYKAE